MTQRIHLIACAQLKLFVDMAVSRARIRTNLSGAVFDVWIEFMLTMYRFVTPIFLHAGLIHFLLNMLGQLTASAQVSLFQHIKNWTLTHP